MNVKQLKDKLKQYSDDSIVLICNCDTDENWKLGENDFSDSKEYFEICLSEDNQTD